MPVITSTNAYPIRLVYIVIEPIPAAAVKPDCFSKYYFPMLCGMQNGVDKLVCLRLIIPWYLHGVGLWQAHIEIKCHDARVCEIQSVHYLS
jgi:hypothetical protein